MKFHETCSQPLEEQGAVWWCDYCMVTTERAVDGVACGLTFGRDHRCILLSGHTRPHTRERGDKNSNIPLKVLFHDKRLDGRLVCDCVLVDDRCPHCHTSVDAQSRYLARQCAALRFSVRCMRPHGHENDHGYVVHMGQVGSTWESWPRERLIMDDPDGVSAADRASAERVWSHSSSILCGHLVDRTPARDDALVAAARRVRQRGYSVRSTLDRADRALFVELNQAVDDLGFPCTLLVGHAGPHESSVKAMGSARAPTCGVSCPGLNSARCDMPPGHVGRHSRGGDEVVWDARVVELKEEDVVRPRPSPGELWRQAASEVAAGEAHDVQARFVALMRDHGGIVDLKPVEQSLRDAWAGVSVCFSSARDLRAVDARQLLAAVTGMADACVSAMEKLK